MKATNDILIRKLLKNGTLSVDKNNWIVLGKKTKIIIDVHGYVVVKYKNKSLKAHRIIYQAKVGNLKSNYQINHIDGNKKNNFPSNLEQVTKSSNMRHMMSSRKKRNMTLTEAKKIRKLYKTTKYTQLMLAEIFDCSTRYIQHILYGNCLNG